MTMLAVQSLLLILAAFFAGAMTACFVRRVFFARDNEHPNPSGGKRLEKKASEEVVTTSTTQTKTTQVSSEETSRFGRALTGQGAREAANGATSKNAASQQQSAAPSANDQQDEKFIYQDLVATAPQKSATPEVLTPSQTPREAVSDTAAIAATTVAATAAMAATSQTTNSAPANDDHVITSAKDPAPLTTSVAEAVLNPDDLTLIRGISPQVSERLNAAGIAHYPTVASWQAEDVARFNEELGFVARIQKQNWIEQAAILSKGEMTEFAHGLKTGEAPLRETLWSLPPVLEDQAATVSAPAPSTKLATPAVDEKSEDMTPVSDPQLSEPVSPEPPAQEPATMSSEAGSDTTAAEPKPQPSMPSSDVAVLRSVKSEALVGADAGRSDNVLTLPTALPANSDDLKRIRGIGVLIEKRLNALGIRNYDQIANWTATDVARVSETLDFKGRIERESWIEQARILASGGYTEFSRRTS